jgi:hypothetical protein
MANRQRDLGKERMWRALIARQQRSSQSVPVFCAARGLPPSALYAWRRIIAQRDRATATTTASTNPVDSEADVPTFVPISITAMPTAATLEVVLGQGRVVRVPAGFDADTLRQLLAVLEVPSC